MSDSSGDALFVERPLTEDFYVCHNTGEWVYKWSDERMVLVTTDEAHELRQHQDGRSWPQLVSTKDSDDE